MKKLGVIFIGFLSVVCFVSCKSSHSNMPTEYVVSIYTALDSGEFEKACSLMTTEEEAKELNTTKDGLIQQRVALLKALGFKLISYEITDESLSNNGNSAVIKVIHKSSSGFGEKESSIQYMFEKENKEWVFKGSKGNL